jgi:hypothetical protein
MGAMDAAASSSFFAGATGLWHEIGLVNRVKGGKAKMVREISGPGFDSLGRARRTDRSRSGRANGKDAGRAEETTRDAGELPTELQSLIERVKQNDTVRLERVHAVMEKLEKGELVTSEAVRDAARRIMEGGV